MEKKEPDVTNDDYEKAIRYFNQKKYKKALALFEKIDKKELFPFEKSKINHFKALTYSYLYDLKNSIKCFDIAFELNPHDPKIPFNKGLTYYYFYDGEKNKEKLLLALKSIEDAILLNSESSYYWYYRGVVLERLNNISDSKESYKKSLKYNKDIKNEANSKLFFKIQKKYLH